MSEERKKGKFHIDFDDYYFYNVDSSESEYRGFEEFNITINKKTYNFTVEEVSRCLDYIREKF